MKLLPLLILIVAIECKAQNVISSDSLFQSSAVIIKEIKEMDKRIGSRGIKSYQLPYKESYGKRTTATIEIQNGYLRKFTYMGYDLGGIPMGREIYYFDSLGKAICSINKATRTASYDVYIDSFMVVYYKLGDTNNSVLHAEDSRFVLASVKYDLDYYLSNIPGLKYSTFDISNNRSFSLTMLRAAPLRQLPSSSSSVIGSLKKDEGVYYQGYSLNRDALDGKGPWVWYQVRTRSGKLGWVWGHPSIINEINEE